MKAPSTKTIVLTLGTLIGLLAIVLVIYFIVKKSKDAGTVLLPNETDWGKSLTDSQSDNVARIAKGLYEDINGFNGWGHTSSIYEEYAACDDVVFVGVANYFAERYGKGANLAKWLDDEVFFSLTSTVDSIKSRLANFGINA